MSQQKFDLLFIKPDGTEDHKTIFCKPASNLVRKELHKLEREMNLAQVTVTKELKKKFPTVYDLVEAEGGDIGKVLEKQENLNLDEYEGALEANEKVADVQVDILFKEIQVMIDHKATYKKTKLRDYHIKQLESEPGETVEIDTSNEHVDEAEVTPEFDFWNNQDLDILREQRKIFFRRAGI